MQVISELTCFHEIILLFKRKIIFAAVGLAILCQIQYSVNIPVSVADPEGVKGVPSNPHPAPVFKYRMKMKTLSQ